MGCPCLTPPPPLFDLPPPPDPSLLLHLLLDEPLEALEKLQLTAASCPLSSSSSLLERLERVGGDFALPSLALLLLCLCLATSGATIALRRRRRKRNGRSGGTAGEQAGAGRKKGTKSGTNCLSSLSSPTSGVALPCGSSSSSSGCSPGHCATAHHHHQHFSRRSSTETVASAASPPVLEQQQQSRGWLFQPNFFAFAQNAATAQFRPNTVGAPRRKLLPASSSSSAFHASAGHPSYSCCSPTTASGLPSPPRTVAIRLPRHFSSSDGQFVAWRTAECEPGACAVAAASPAYGFYGCGGGSEVYEELAGEDIAQAPYKLRVAPPSALPRRMPPPASRPPPPPPEHLLTNANANAICCSPYAGRSPGSSSAEDLEANGRPRGNSGGITGQSRTESGYGTGRSGAAKRLANGIWRGQQQLERSQFCSPKNGLPPSVANGRANPKSGPPALSFCQASPEGSASDGGEEDREEEEYVDQQKAMTYV